jgi:hypothetical protein
MTIKATTHIKRALVLAGLALASPALAGLSISTTTNIAGGIAGFGTATPAITWASYNGSSFVDPGTGATASGNLFITNWINGPGFDRNGSPAPDLAINGPENFTLGFAAPVSRLGFAVSTGLGLLPNEVSAASTSFTLRIGNGDTAVLTLTNPGNGLALWVDLQSTTPFTSLQFSENGNDQTDQYFGDFVSGNLPMVGGVPEPASWAMLIGGFGLTGAFMRRRRWQGAAR